MTKNLLVFLHIKSGLSEEFDELFEKQFIRRSRGEAGCLEYRLWSDEGDPEQKVIIERWATQEDLDRHLAQPWFKEYGPVMESYQAVPLTIRFFEEGVCPLGELP